MKIAICYATNSKTTGKCAQYLAEKLGADLFDLSRLKKKLPDISGYDAVIVGSPIRMGVLHDGAIVFMNTNKELLLSKKTAYFLCCGYPENKEQYFAEQFPRSLIEASAWHDAVGGELILENMGFFDRMMMRSAARSPEGLPEYHIDYAKLDELAAMLI